MIAVSPTLTPTLNRRRRNAFTLLEVLVVVAILVVLASVASVAVFRYLDDAKVDKAKLDMQVLEKSYKSLVIKKAGEVDQTNFQLPMLAEFLEQGQNGLIDPWGKPYTFYFGTDGAGEERIYFTTVNPKTQETITWPLPRN